MYCYYEDSIKHLHIIMNAINKILVFRTPYVAYQHCVACSTGRGRRVAPAGGQVALSPVILC